jgi:hypothetical protein
MRLQGQRQAWKQQSLLLLAGTLMGASLRPFLRLELVEQTWAMEGVFLVDMHWVSG